MSQPHAIDPSPEFSRSAPSCDESTDLGARDVDVPVALSPDPAKAVFVSYVFKDREAALELCRRLEEAGIACWIAPRDVRPGDDYGESILRAIDSATTTILMFSRHTSDSPHVRNEIERSVNKRKRLIPIRLEDAPPRGSLELHLATAQWIDAWNLAPEELTRQVVAAVRPETVIPFSQNPVEKERSGPVRSVTRRAVIALLLLTTVPAAAFVLARRLIDPAAQRSEPVTPAEALKVVSLEVRHFARTPDGDVPKGPLGQRSFMAYLGDRVQVEARLSKPCYAYLIAFRPDGAADLCFPDDENTVPPLTDTPRYPNDDKLMAYGLQEGIGLWAFAVVASEAPLPSWSEWRRKRTGGGASFDWSAIDKTPTAVVWLDDGTARFEYVTPDGSSLRMRGKDESLEGPAVTIKRLTDSLRREWAGSAVSTVGFGVHSDE